jgi:hypothetical protein
MSRRRAGPLVIAAAVAACATPAEAKFRASLVLEPVQPLVRQTVRVTVRTEIILPRAEQVRLFAVGRWREPSGQGVLDVPLVRVRPRAFAASLRFPYSGRWSLQVMSSSGAILVARDARVGQRPRA